MKLEIKAQVIFRDKNGKITKVINKELNSYVMQIIDFLRASMNKSADNITDVGGTGRPLQISGNYLAEIACNAGANDDNFGILVGKSSTAVAITQYNLVDKILQGSTSGKLSYGAVSVGSTVTVGSTRNYTIARTFTNNTASDIAVTEVGLFAQSYYTGANIFYTMLERSLLSFTVVAGTSGTVTYTISATV